MRRFTWLDALRGLAALSVVVAHASQLFVGFAWLAPYALGSFAVNVFFVVSGFVIPLTLRQTEAPWRFAVRRMCRLFPLYLSCLAAAVMLRLWGLLPVSVFVAPITMHDLMVNLTMLQLFSASAPILSVAWTLSYELVFYALLIALLFFHLYQKTVVVSLVLIGGVFATTLLSPVAPSIGTALGALMLVPHTLAIMWCGTLASRVLSGDIDRRHGRLLVEALMIATLLGSLSHLHAFLEMISLIAAVLAVLLLCRVERRPAPAPLQSLGRISYSMYLIHIMVLTAIPALPNPLLRITVWLLVLLPVATVTERWIERPGIALGRKLTRRSPLSAAVSPATVSPASFV